MVNRESGLGVSERLVLIGALSPLGCAGGCNSCPLRGTEYGAGNGSVAHTIDYMLLSCTFSQVHMVLKLRPLAGKAPLPPPGICVEYDVNWSTFLLGDFPRPS